MRKCLVEPSLCVNKTSCSMSTSQPKPSFVSGETCQLTRDASRMFQNLGMVEIGSTSREIVREAIKFFRDATQYLLHIRLAATTGGPTQQLLGNAIISAIKRTQGPMPSPPPSVPPRPPLDPDRPAPRGAEPGSRAASLSGRRPA